LIRFKLYSFLSSQVVSLCWLFLGILFYSNSTAQIKGEHPVFENTFIEPRMHFGFVLKHRNRIGHLQSGHFAAYEINAGFQTYGKNPWDKLYNYPKIGCVFWYSDLKKSPYLGSAYGLYPYMNFSLIKGDVFNFNFRFGTGLGYMSKVFERTSNYKNITISSHINALIAMFFDTQWKINPRLTIITGIGLTHFSNGAFKSPNLGINIPSITTGANWFLSQKQHEKIEVQPPMPTKKYEINNFITFGLKEMHIPLHQKYFTCSYSGILFKLNKQKNKYGIGIDAFYNSGNLSVLELPAHNFQSNIFIIRIGTSIAYELIYNHLSFIMQTGYYIRNNDNLDGSIYSRFGLRYLLTKHWYVNLTLKTHFAKADNIESGLGFKF